jgi:hypothetical protein
VDGARLDDMEESMVEVDPLSLLESSNNPSSLSALQCVVRIEFILEEPFARADVGAWWYRYECPRVGAHKMPISCTNMSSICKK